MESLLLVSAKTCSSYRRLIVDAALCFYEYIITIDLEVDFFWRGRLTGATLLFLTNRYIVMATLVLGVSTVMMSFPPEVSLDVNNDWAIGALTDLTLEVTSLMLAVLHDCTTLTLFAS